MSTIEGPAPDTCDSFADDGFELLDPAGADVLAVGPEADLAPGRDEDQDDILQQAAEVVSQMAASTTTISQEVEGDSATELGGAADAGEAGMDLDMLAPKAPDCSEEPTQTELCAGSLEKLLKEHAELSRLARQRAEELEALTGRLQGTVRFLLALLAFAGVLAAGSLTGFAYVWSARTELLHPATRHAGIHDLHVDGAPTGGAVHGPAWHHVFGASRPAQQAEEWPSLKYALAAPHPSESLEQRWLGKNPENLLAYQAQDAAEEEVAATGRWQRMLWAQGNVSYTLMAALRKKDAMIDSMRESAMAKSALIKTLRASASSLRATLREQFRLGAHVGDAMREKDILIRTLNGSTSSLRIRLRRQHMRGTDLHKMLREQEQWIRVVNSTAMALEAALGANRQFGWALRAKLAASGRVIAALNATVASLRQRVARPADEARARGGTWWPMAIATPGAPAAPSTHSSTMSGTVHAHKERQDCVSAWRAIASTVLVPSPRVEAASTAVALFVADGWSSLGAVARRAQNLLRLQLPAPHAQPPGLVVATEEASCPSGPAVRPIHVAAAPALNVKSCPAEACGLAHFRGRGDALVLAGPMPGSKGLLLLDTGLREKERQAARQSDSRTSRPVATRQPPALSAQARAGWGPTNRTAVLPASGGARAPTSFPLLARARLQ